MKIKMASSRRYAKISTYQQTVAARRNGGCLQASLRSKSMQQCCVVVTILVTLVILYLSRDSGGQAVVHPSSTLKVMNNETAHRPGSSADVKSKYEDQPENVDVQEEEQEKQDDDIKHDDEKEEEGDENDENEEGDEEEKDEEGVEEDEEEGGEGEAREEEEDGAETIEDPLQSDSSQTAERVAKPTSLVDSLPKFDLVPVETIRENVFAAKKKFFKQLKKDYGSAFAKAVFGDQWTTTCTDRCRWR